MGCGGGCERRAGYHPPQALSPDLRTANGRRPRGEPHDESPPNDSRITVVGVEHTRQQAFGCQLLGAGSLRHQSSVSTIRSGNRDSITEADLKVLASRQIFTQSK
jgi:hypothetical protein